MSDTKFREMSRGFFGYALAAILSLGLAFSAYGQAKFPYPILDSGVWVAKIWTPKVVWLDNYRILFAGSEDGTYKTAHVPTISLWEIGKGVSIYKKHATMHCYQQGILWYAQGPAKPRQWIQMRGPLGQEKPYEKPSGKFIQTDFSNNCGYVDLAFMRERGRAGGPLLLNHGYLDMGSNAPSETMKNQPVVFYRAGDPKGVPMPFKSREFWLPRYVQFKNAYFVVGDFFDTTRRINVSQWPSGLPQPLWWLTPSGDVTQITISPNLRGSVGHHVPTVKGIYFVGGVSASDSDAGDMGGYLLQGSKVDRVIGGLVEGEAVSPDGCKLAFAHAQSLAANLANSNNRRTLKMIDVCKGEKS